MISKTAAPPAANASVRDEPDLEGGGAGGELRARRRATVGRTGGSTAGMCTGVGSSLGGAVRGAGGSIASVGEVTSASRGSIGAVASRSSGAVGSGSIGAVASGWTAGKTAISPAFGSRLPHLAQKRAHFADCRPHDGHVIISCPFATPAAPYHRAGL